MQDPDATNLTPMLCQYSSIPDSPRCPPNPDDAVCTVKGNRAIFDMLCSHQNNGDDGMCNIISNFFLIYVSIYQITVLFCLPCSLNPNLVVKSRAVTPIGIRDDYFAWHGHHYLTKVTQ